ncbi:MAG: ATP synthase F1 subunit gamma [Planctomycetes bacterium]|nr:ATP synthase F1 subunit gamma [Planctomycetota bacterium]
MANVKELRGRIKSIANIAKITKAMEMVASMKLRRVQGRAAAFRPYTEELRSLLEHLGDFVGTDADLPLFRRREVKTIGVLVITSDRGLCGAYNANVLAKVTALRASAEAEGKQLVFYVIGKKGYAWLGRRGLKVKHFYAEPPLESLDFRTARVASDDLVGAFQKGELDEVRLVFTAFHSAARFEPRNDRFLPVGSDLVATEEAKVNARQSSYLLEPDPQAIFERILPKYLQTVVMDAMIESLAAEMASRRMAMKGATDAASRMGKELKKKYNRARQETITKELLDIVGGASAVS